MAAHPAISAITMAFNASSPAMNTSGKSANINPFASSATAARRPAGLPLTPPNSMSPNLPAFAVRNDAASPPPMQFDQEASESAPVPLSKGALSGLESAQAITPAMLARNYLPTIMLGHGPVAIKHVMGCLTQSVPGFSRMPPAKARRIVVAALESRAGGGIDGNIEFEKVGWGRWDAHVKGEQSPDRSSGAFIDGKMSPPTSEFGSYAASHAGSAYPIKNHRPTYNNDVHGQSWTGSSMPSVDEGLEYMSMSENEADNMSLDGSETNDSMSDSGEETEPEDWAAIGADAMRKASIPTAASGSIRRNYNLLCIPGSVYNRRFSNSTNVRKTSQTLFTQSAPSQERDFAFSHSPSIGANGFGRSPSNVLNNTCDASMDLDQTPQERDAIQALLSMGSM